MVRGSFYYLKQSLLHQRTRLVGVPVQEPLHHLLQIASVGYMYLLYHQRRLASLPRHSLPFFSVPFFFFFFIGGLSATALERTHGHGHAQQDLTKMHGTKGGEKLRRRLTKILATLKGAHGATSGDHISCTGAAGHGIGNIGARGAGLGTAAVALGGAWPLTNPAVKRPRLT